jgi:hypothetical protein
MKSVNKSSQRGAIQHFASVCHHIKPQKCRTFVTFLLPQFTSIFKDADPLIMIALAGTANTADQSSQSTTTPVNSALTDIMRTLGYYIEEKECHDLIFESLLPLLSDENVEVRRSTASCVGIVCRYILKCPLNEVCLHVYDLAVNTIKSDSEEYDDHTELTFLEK